jgi:hypothetical protein
MKLHDYLDIEKLEEQIAEGYVNRNFQRTSSGVLKSWRRKKEKKGSKHVTK